MGVQFTIVRELLDAINVPRNLRLGRYKTDSEYAKRMIVSLQSDLANLNSALNLVLQKMNINQKFQDIKLHYSVSRFQTIDFLQAIRPLQAGSKPDPDPRIAWAMEQLANPKDDITKSLNALISERDRIGNEIISVSTQIKQFETSLEEIQKNLDPKTNGGVDLSAQMEKDSIAKRLYAEVYMLYEVAYSYWTLTHDENGARKYNADAITLNKLQKASTMFQAYSERNPYVLSGDITLDKDDPGSDDNLKKIGALLERARQVCTIPESQKLDPKMEKYSSLLRAHINDSYTSKEVIKAIESIRNPPIENKFDTVTATPAKTIKQTNAKIVLKALQTVMSWTGDSQAQAATTWFKKFVSGVNQGLPYCTPTPIDEETKKRLEQDAQSKEAETAGGKLVAAAFAQSKNTVPKTEQDAAIKNYNDQIDAAITDYDTTGSSTRTDVPSKYIPGTYVLNMKSSTGGSWTFTAKNLYQVRILTVSDRYVNYLVDLNVSGNINSTEYDIYMSDLVIKLDKVRPPFTES